MLIEMTIKGLTVDPVTNMPIVILRDQHDQRVLPIWVGVSKPTPSHCRSRTSTRRGR